MTESTQDSNTPKSRFPYGGYGQDHGDWYVMFRWVEPVGTPDRRAIETLALQVCGNCNETFNLFPAYDLYGVAWLQELLDLPHEVMSPQCDKFMPSENLMREW